MKGYADPLFALGYGLAAWAARSPSATSIAKAGPADEAGWLRRTAVGLSVFFPAVTGAALLSVGNRINLAMYLTVTILIGVLVAVRVAALVHRVSRSRAELHALVRRDSLTGLRNRTALLEDAERLLAGLDTLDTPENGAAFAVLLVDLDRFKIVNDSLGHGAGDHLLGLAAARLRAVAGDEARVYRLGGDEFVVLAEGLRGEHQALEAGHRLVRELSRVYELDGVEAWISASVGIGFAEPRSDAAGLLRDADLAMYQVKRPGRDGVHVFDRAMRDEVRARQSLESELRRAVEAAAVEVAYQPYVELASGRLVGFEALARIASGGGQLDAAEFIGVAEQIGLVGRIGELVLADAASQAARWNRGRRGPAVRVSVNLSTQQLLDPRLVARVAAALAEAGCRPEWVTLELTETSLVADPPAAAWRLAELHDLGVRLAIDDFGAGYSSLAYLREFPVDQLKVDQQFVRDLGASPSARSLAGSMVALAHGLGLEVIGEGVERAEQAAALLELGCEHGQGYLYGPPLDAGWAAARARSAGRGDVEPAALAASHAGAPR
ncbi:MAG: putative bifunctional diguanylate cyclase/phosphodiesterase [Acidimicrobiales bacterium]